MLDVGCGTGAYLAEVQRETGCDASGIDLSRQAVKVARARGLTVTEGMIHDLDEPPGTFQLITAWWYLEHAPDPADAVDRVAQLLADGGRFVFGVPNARSINAWLFGSRWYHLDCPRHLCLYTPAALRRLLQAHGLRIDTIRFERNSMGLVGSIGYLLFGSASRPAFARFMRSRLFELLALPLTSLGASMRLSDAVVVTAVKLDQSSG